MNKVEVYQRSSVNKVEIYNGSSTNKIEIYNGSSVNKLKFIKGVQLITLPCEEGFAYLGNDAALDSGLQQRPVDQKLSRGQVIKVSSVKL